ncbi:(4Fe-4S)-binding protein [Halobacteriales archaeon QS_1_68_20]|nr:MAG: (4Fe-4S)-binding protein [Halobacteriales archaeon QS_1_68_20]
MSSREQKAAEIRRLLATEGEAVSENARGFNRGREEATAELDDYDELKATARARKEDAIERLPELIEQVRESVEARGGNVYLAEDEADANAYVREVADGADVETAVKSKSMTTEEIELNEALGAAGVDVWETDLGEFVLQVAEEAPSHLVGPAIHRDRESIAELFEAHFDPGESLETADDLTRFARTFLGERIADADLGLTGANFVAAEEGTLVLVTSEGNARKTVTATDVHVAVAGAEKLLPSVADLGPFLELIARSATGQSLTSYLTFLTPPGSAPTVDFEGDEMGAPGDREFHLVLLDNGRFEMREDEQLRETLYCIRCGACANACANFQQVGGHAFGGETYTGGIAGGWEAGVHGLDSAAEFNDLCTGCTRCVPACPVGIDVPWINTVVRDRVERGADPSRFDFLVDGLAPDAESGGSLQKRLFGNVGTLAKVASMTAPVSNWLVQSTLGKWALARLGVDPRRDLPQFRRRTLRDWFESRGRTRVANPEREVVLYPDVYTDYADVERGKAAVRALEAVGVGVRIPSLPESGRAPLSQGMIATAEQAAERVLDGLEPHLDAGRDVVVVEPSDLAMFRRDYDRLVPERVDRLAANSYEVLEYLHGVLANGADLDALADLDGERLAFHPHCQARTLELAAHTEWVLEERGADVETTTAECCGMAGSFGYKQEYYELSVAVGEALSAELPEDRRVVASGTSCLDQLADLGRSPRHPVELLASAG